MAPQESLLKIYADRSYRHVTMARHQGTTVAFAMDESRRIVYLFLSTTARLTVDAPFHVVSDGTYVVVLRQSVGETHSDAVYKLTGGGCSGSASRTDYVLSGTKKVPLVRDTLLCDRFLLVDGKLKPVLEVRYKRSRHATRPESAKDSLGTEDMEGRPFHEPTQELPFVRNLTQGRFAALPVPTAISGVQRWQLFAHNDATGRVDSFSVEQGAQGLFNTRGIRFHTSPDPLYRDAVFERNRAGGRMARSRGRTG
ncbi:hypothetical protein [Streptomyces sp. NPDC029003]|uniref:hypothetical protein n=1 Tax=Streptomyces sp. NPDC029003 TaxID=3155125 RepID=UPI0033EF3127